MTLRELYLHELNDLYSAENQLIKALPKMAEAASSEDLRLAFELHLEQTQEQVERLEIAFSRLHEKPAHMTCKAMMGLIEEGEEMIRAHGDPAVKDTGLVGAAQRVEHCEMAAYGCARTHAEMLGEQYSTDPLQTTLDEERATDETLTGLASCLINLEAELADQLSCGALQALGCEWEQTWARRSKTH